MSNTKWTPGPWSVIWSIPEEGTDCFWIMAEPSKGFQNQIAAADGYQHQPEREANAYLIAAAPDLAEEHQEWSEVIGRVFVMLRQAQYSEAMKLLDDTFMIDFSSGAPVAESPVMAKARGES